MKIIISGSPIIDVLYVYSRDLAVCVLKVPVCVWSTVLELCVSVCLCVFVIAVRHSSLAAEV